MRYQVTPENNPVLTDVLQLITDTRRLLPGADTFASIEWDRMRIRFPSGDDLRQGFISLSTSELEEVRFQLERFRSAVNDNRAPADPGLTSMGDGWALHPMAPSGADNRPARAS